MKWTMIAIFMVLTSCATAPEPSASYPDGAQLAVTQNIKVVYGIGGDRQRQGVGEGLFFTQRLVQNYEKQGIPPEQRTVVAVLYNEAAYWLLNEQAWARTAPSGALAGPTNPNAQLISTLLKSGVRLEICGTTMKKNGWTKDDLLPGVVVVPGAFARIVDLQLQGFAYVAFDRGTP